MKQYENYINKSLMVHEGNQSWYTKTMPRIHINRILNARVVSHLGYPIIFKNPLNPDTYHLDYYMYSQKQRKGKKYYHRNSLGEVVFPRMYRYVIDEETFFKLFCTETLGRNYNIVIKQAIGDSIKMFDYMKELDKAPTRRDVAKIARTSELMRFL